MRSVPLIRSGVGSQDEERSHSPRLTMQWGVFTFICGSLLLSLLVSTTASTDKSEGTYMCLLPMDTGPCKALFLRYFFNRLTQKCQMFPYGGCMGNENNFESKKECLSRCGRFIRSDFWIYSDTGQICSMPIDVGPCKAMIPRFYYNAKTQMCEHFDYGGCKGNENNFLTYADCQKQCGKTMNKRNVCSQPVAEGLCYLNILRYFFNVKSQECEKFIFGGCEGNENNFLSKRDCLSYCERTIGKKTECSLPHVQGPCKGRFPRYYYNTKRMKCFSFTYGGCKGNKNNFTSEKECTLHCQKSKIPQISSKCWQPQEPGRCRAYFRRYFYNFKMGMCEEFVYGGCNGNGNNFKDQYSCQLECNPSSLIPSFCTKPKDRGACKANIPRLYFNPDSYSCEKFSYTGCGGNDNNFSTLKSCQKICRPRARKQLKKKPITTLKYS